MKIELLTAEQIAKFPDFIEKWTKIGLSTEPADRPKAEAAIREMYGIAGLPPPKKIIWCGSPLSQGITRAIILDKKFLKDVRDSVGDSVGDSVRASVWASVRASVRASVLASVGDSVYGQHDAGWLAFYHFFHQALNLRAQTEKLSGLWNLCASAGWAIPHQNICWVSERHSVLLRDERGRLHSLAGPACAYPDGWAIYAVHGVRVPAWIIESPQDITSSKIDGEANAEIRRVMIERFGASRYIKDSGAEIVHSLPDNYYVRGLQGAKLYRKPRSDDSDIIMISVMNSTPEPDGSIKEYNLRIQPTAYHGLASRDCHAAMASTWRNQDGTLFYKRPQDYAPRYES